MDDYALTRPTHSLIIAGLLNLLSACSGSSGDGSANLVVDIGPAQTIVLAEAVELDATVTRNRLPVEGPIRYRWTQLSGPGTVTFSNPEAEDTSARFSAIGSYTLALNVSTGGLDASESVNVTVNLKAAGPTGLIARPINSTACIAPATPPVATRIRLEDPFPNLPTLTAPIALLMAPGDSGHWYVVQQTGQVLRFENAFGTSIVDTFIDIADGRLEYGGEMGLLGMAFHPDYANNGYVFLSYTSNQAGLQSRISRFKLDATGRALDPASEQVVLSVDQPYSNHNGGQIAFGPDGLLYVGLGDGGAAGDPDGNGQNTSTLLGSMLRIDVGDGSSAGYTIPADNPFASSGGRPEIYAYGLRNPWRWSFDRNTGDLWLGDVGQDAYEEIDIITTGGNYGWNTMEGRHCYNTVNCDQTGLIMPVAEYDHSQGFAVTGGYVYRGDAIAFLQGRYLYADFATGRIWALTQTGADAYASEELLDTSLNIASFAEDHNGELYVVDLGGSILKISGDGGSQTGRIPALLSEWGCFEDADTSRFSSHVIPYDVNTRLWSDGAEKSRFMAIPDGTTIDIDDQGHLDLPVGSVVGKHFYLGDRLIETRLLLHHQPPHGWKGYSYEWDLAETEATLLTTAKDTAIDGQIWHYPSRAECDACHTAVAGFTLGPEVGQLNRAFTYEATGIEANQLITLESINMLTRPLTDDEKSTALYAIDDTAYSAERRARSYLHVNCANCHQPGGPGGGNIDLRIATPLEHTGICNQAPLGDTLGLMNPVIIAPGEPDQSILLLRMEHPDQHRMPPLASSIVDSEATAVIRSWISDLAKCP